MKLYRIFATALTALTMAAAMTSCSDDKSYADLLNDETRVVNAFLAEHRLVDRVPADTVFEIGPNAPYYRIDDESNVYMQVLDKGSDERAKPNARVYFRYIRYDLSYYVVGSDSNIGSGNSNNMASGSTFFIFDNYQISQSSQYGEGIQMPLKFLGYDCKVNLVVKSQAGPDAEIASVIPYLYTISYYKPGL